MYQNYQAPDLLFSEIFSLSWVILATVFFAICSLHRFVVIFLTKVQSSLKFTKSNVSNIKTERRTRAYGQIRINYNTIFPIA